MRRRSSCATAAASRACSRTCATSGTEESTSVPEPAFLQPGEGESLRIVGESVRVLADGASTAGACFVFEETTRPGHGPPLHTHAREDEFFYVVEGSVKFVVDGRETVVRAGGAAFAPRGSAHTFCNVGDSPS